jgi:hypothetical protein
MIKTYFHGDFELLMHINGQKRKTNRRKKTTEKTHFFGQFCFDMDFPQKVFCGAVKRTKNAITNKIK